MKNLLDKTKMVANKVLKSKLATVSIALLPGGLVVLASLWVINKTGKQRNTK